MLLLLLRRRPLLLLLLLHSHADLFNGGADCRLEETKNISEEAATKRVSINVAAERRCKHRNNNNMYEEEEPRLQVHACTLGPVYPTAGRPCRLCSGSEIPVVVYNFLRLKSTI